MGRIIAPLNFPLVLLDNLIAFWNLDETSGTRYDSSGNGRNLTQTFGTVSSTTGKIKNCAYFNGINGGGSTNSKLGSTSFGVNPNSNFSMSVWIKPRSFSSYQHIIGAPFQNGFYIGANNSNLTFNLYNGTLYGVSAPSTALNTWHHYVFIREGSTLKLYADNVYIGSASITGQSFPGASVFSVGGGEYNEYYFNGDIDALGLWTRVLTESEIGTLYNNGNGKQYIDNKISIKKQNLGGGKITIKRNNLFTCPFEVDTDTCPSIGGLSGPGWLKGSNISRIQRTTAPDNSNSAVIYESIDSPNCFVSQGFLQYWRPYTRYEFSIWTKLIAGEAAEGNIMNITRNGGADRVVLPAIGNLTSEWQKFTITFTTGGSVSSYVTAFFAENFQGGTQIALWGAEMYINK